MVRKTRKSFPLLLSVLVFLLILAFDFASCLARERTGQKPLWLVVTRPGFSDSLKPLEEKRQSEGFETVISTKAVSEAINSLSQKPAYLLLVGDYQRDMEKEPWYIPAKTCQAYRWQAIQARDLASDALWGDLDNDMIPDIPVGRLPVRTIEQLQLLVTKILAFENMPPSENDLRLPIYTGSANYGQAVDSMTTQLLLNTINANGALWLRPWIISDNRIHPLCGWPEEHEQTFIKQLKEGGLMAVLMGHGSISSFNGKGFDIAKELLAEGNPAPPAAIISCHCGNFTASQNCLAESLLFLPAGPVATIGATTASHPMTNYFTGLCLLRKPDQTSPNENRLGTFWLNAQKEAMETHDIIIELLLMNIEGKLEAKIDTNKLRRDHILMYALLGDPATLLHTPQSLECKFDSKGDTLHWQAEKPKDALKLYVEICPDGQTMPQIQLPLEKDSAQKNLQLANDTFAFNKIAELSADQTWEGSINTPGILRLVALTPHNIYVTAKKIELNAPK
jgi:hypothetical protein